MGWPSSKTNADATKLLQRAKAWAKKIPTIFVTDGLAAYLHAFKKVFAPKNLNQKYSYHIRDIHIKDEMSNNNIHERFNSTIRAKHRSWRGVKGVNSPCFALLRLHYNHVRHHGSLGGGTPGEAAGIKIDHPDKFLTIIENAAYDAI